MELRRLAGIHPDDPNRLFRGYRLLALCALVGLAFLWILWPPLPGLLCALFLLWLVATAEGRQALAIARVGLATVRERLGATSVVVVGIGGVVAVLVALQAMAAGFEASLNAAGSDDVAIIMRAGANAELSSGLARDSTTVIVQAPGIARDVHDLPIASTEVVVVANIPKRTTGTPANVEVRGVGLQAWELRPQVRLLAGRRFVPGRRELIVGEGAARQFRGLGLGATFSLNHHDWRIVGIFASGDAHDSEIWGDAESIAAAYRRNGFQSVSVRLAGPGALERLRRSLQSDPRLQVDVETSRAYYGKQSQRLTQVIRGIGYGVAVIMALGAVFGALNTMYAAVANRAREIATLRALGFTAGPVVVAILLETLVLAALGGALGAGVAWGLFHGFTVSTLGANFSQVVFQFRVTPSLLVHGLEWALVLGFLGGLLPALRAASLPVTTALRES